MGQMGRLCQRGGIKLPSPTKRLDVSGIKSRRSVRLRPERIVKSQNIQCHDSDSVRTPPKTGPRLGAEFVLHPYQKDLRLKVDSLTSPAGCRRTSPFPREERYQQ